MRAQARLAATFDRRYEEQFQAGVDAGNQGSAAVEALRDPVVAKISDEANAADHKHDAAVVDQLFPAARRGDRAATLRALADADAAVDVILAKTLTIEEHLGKRRQAAVAAARSATSDARLFALLAALAAGALDAVAGGDLTVEAVTTTEPIVGLGRDEMGQVGGAVNAIRDSTAASVGSYNRMREGLHALVGDLSSAAQTVASSSQEMASTSDESGRAVGEIAYAIGDVAQGLERQVRSIESTRMLTEDVAQATGASAREAESATDAAAQAREVASQGVHSAQVAADAMAAVRASSTEATETIRELGAKSEEITGIVATITGIAEQTTCSP